MDPIREYTKACEAAGMFSESTDPQFLPICETDALIVVDMQNDFLPVDLFNPHGGKFGVTGGANAGAHIVDLIAEFASKGAHIVATRDYHPYDHASFNGRTKGAWFPPHCIQGSIGSMFYPPIKAALQFAREKSSNPTKQVCKMRQSVYISCNLQYFRGERGAVENK